MDSATLARDYAERVGDAIKTRDFEAAKELALVGFLYAAVALVNLVKEDIAAHP